MAGYNLTDEQNIVRQLIAGKEAAFELLYNSYKRPLAANILRLVKSEELASEILQNLFIKVWNNRGQVDPEKPFKAYLYRMAKNMVVDVFRKAARDERLHQHLMRNATEIYSHIEEDIYQKEQESMVMATIDRLPPQRKRIFLLFKIEGKSYQEISDELGISKATINEHITKANRFLREQLIGPSSVTTVALIAGVVVSGL